MLILAKNHGKDIVRQIVSIRNLHVGKNSETISGHPCEKENLYVALHLLHPFLHLSHPKLPWCEALSSLTVTVNQRLVGCDVVLYILYLFLKIRGVNVDYGVIPYKVCQFLRSPAYHHHAREHTLPITLGKRLMTCRQDITPRDGNRRLRVHYSLAEFSVCSIERHGQSAEVSVVNILWLAPETIEVYFPLFELFPCIIPVNVNSLSDCQDVKMRKACLYP